MVLCATLRTVLREEVHTKGGPTQYKPYSQTAKAANRNTFYSKKQWIGFPCGVRTDWREAQYNKSLGRPASNMCTKEKEHNNGINHLNFWSQSLSPGTSREGAPRTLRSHGAAPRRPKCTAPRRPMALPLKVGGAMPLEVSGDKLWDQTFQVWVVFRPLQPKRAIPHPITIQNMRLIRR